MIPALQHTEDRDEPGGDAHVADLLDSLLWELAAVMAERRQRHLHDGRPSRGHVMVEAELIETQISGDALQLLLRIRLSCRERKTDGLIEPRTLEGLAAFYRLSRRRLATLLDELRDAELIGEEGQDLNYLTWNPSTDQREAERESATQRKQEQREREANGRPPPPPGRPPATDPPPSPEAARKREARAREREARTKSPVTLRPATESHSGVTSLEEKRGEERKTESTPLPPSPVENSAAASGGSGVRSVDRTEEAGPPMALSAEAVALLQGYQELDYPQPSAVDQIRAQEFVDELPGWSVPDMLRRMREHIDWCRMNGRQPPRTLAAFWSTLRREYDHLRDEGKVMVRLPGPRGGGAASVGAVLESAGLGQLAQEA